MPKYAPELNPAYKVWSYPKYSRMANYTPQSTIQLRKKMTDEIHRINKNTRLIHSFVRATGLDPYAYSTSGFTNWWLVYSGGVEVNYYAVLTTEVVPEPTSILLVCTGVGALALIGYRRRRKRTALTD